MTTRSKRNAKSAGVEAVIGQDGEMLKRLIQEALQQVLEAEMTETVGASPGERTTGRLGYRAGYYSRGLMTRIGKLELRVSRDRDGRFSTELFARYQRSEKALVSALAEMYVPGVSTRKVKAITEELCGHTFSASTISRINTSLDGRRCGRRHASDTSRADAESRQPGTRWRREQYHLGAGVQSSSACSSRISKPRNIRWLKRVAAVEARSSHRAMVLRERPVTRAVAEMLMPSTRRLATWSNSLRLQRRPAYTVPVCVLSVCPHTLQRYRRRRPDFVANEPWPTMLRPGFPKLSHPSLAHAISSIAFIAQVYRGAKPVVSPTTSEGKVTDQQRPAQAPRRAGRARCSRCRSRSPHPGPCSFAP